MPQRFSNRSQLHVLRPATDRHPHYSPPQHRHADWSHAVLIIPRLPYHSRSPLTRDSTCTAAFFTLVRLLAVYTHGSSGCSTHPKFYFSFLNCSLKQRTAVSRATWSPILSSSGVPPTCPVFCFHCFCPKKWPCHISFDMPLGQTARTFSECRQRSTA